jgi:protocatechuate 3,4-dioxygenase beta subunit
VKLPITRRRFVRDTASGLLTVALVGCGSDSPDQPVGADAALNSPDADPSAPDSGPTPTCGNVTAANIEGPFFTPSSPPRTDLTEAGMIGQRLQITGQVFDVDCVPLVGATLDFWQADDAGGYDEVGFDLRGHQFSDSDGRYQLDTIIPGHYLNGAQFRPAHIHVKATAPGFGVLTTQLYFAGDEFNDKDPFIVDSLIMQITDGDGGRKDAVFDFVLVG